MEIFQFLSPCVVSLRVQCERIAKRIFLVTTTDFSKLSFFPFVLDHVMFGVIPHVVVIRNSCWNLLNPTRSGDDEDEGLWKSGAALLVIQDLILRFIASQPPPPPVVPEFHQMGDTVEINAISEIHL